MNLAKGFLSLLAALVVYTAATAQKAAKRPQPVTGTYTRTVTRLVRIADTTDYSLTRLRPENSDSTLTELLVAAVARHRLKAYTNDDNKLVSPVDADDVLERIQSSKPIKVLDPVTGKKVSRPADINVDLREATWYMVLEEWKYDAATGSTNIQVTGIAPLVVMQDNEAAGKVPLCWFRYSDVKNFFKAYELQHINCSLPLALWGSYFNEKETRKN